MPDSKLKIVANPTFQAMVKVPIAGAEPREVIFTFKHMTRKDLGAYFNPPADAPRRTDAQIFADLVESWGFEEPFSPESVEILIDNYYEITAAVVEAYLDALGVARAKN